MRYLILILALLVASGCTTLNKGAELVSIAGKAVDISVQVDLLQEKYGEYSNNQLALLEVDNIQSDMKLAMMGDLDTLKMLSLKSRVETVYYILRQEVTDQWEELSPEQQYDFRTLNSQILLLGEAIDSFVEVGDSTRFSEALKLALTITADSLKVYSAYKVIK